MRHLLTDFVQQTLLAPTPTPGGGGGIIPNPPAEAPPNVESPVSLLMAYLKWGVLIAILVAAFVGVGAIAAGRVLAHHGASKIGIGILLAALGASVLYVSVYAIITSVTS